MPTQFHTYKSLSDIDVGVAVLLTSFVSHRRATLLYQLCYNSFQVSHLVFRHWEPSFKQSYLALLVIPALLSQLISYTGRPLYAAVPLAFTTYIGCLIFFTLVYRLSPFHPLAKYPGPVIAKTSKWWAAYISAIGDSHRYYKHLHDRYGDVVRIGRFRHLSFVIYPLIHLQALTSSRFAMPLSFIPFSAKVACPKDHVRTSHTYIYSLATSDDDD